MKNKLSLLLILLILAFLPSSAQESNTGAKPNLNGHNFIPASFIRTPFTNSILGTAVGYGQTRDLEFPIPIIDGDTLPSLTGEVIFARLGVQYQQRVQDWIAFYSRIFLAARLGTDIESIIFEGFNTVTSIELGSLIRVIRTDKIQLSASYEIQNYQANFIDITGFVEDIINQVDDPKAVREVPALTTGVGLIFAWGLSPTFGIGLNAEYSYGETFIRGENDSRYTTAFFAEADLYPKLKVPLGLVASFSVTTEPEVVYVEDRRAELLAIKLAYTGRKDFDFGIETTIINLPFEKADKKPNVTNISFTMAYFFD